MNAIDSFYPLYKKLREKEKTNFSRLIHKMLMTNYLTSQKESDLEDYYFITGNLELFQAYFLLMDCELTFDSSNRVLQLSSKDHNNRLNLRINESIVLLILRLLYDEKMREISLVNKVIVNLESIHDMFITTGLKERRLSKTELKQILSLFKRYNLIDVLDYDFNDDESRIILYPTILYAVNIENITEVYNKLSLYKKEGEKDEETCED